MNVPAIQIEIGGAYNNLDLILELSKSFLLAIEYTRRAPINPQIEPLAPNTELPAPISHLLTSISKSTPQNTAWS